MRRLWRSVESFVEDVAHALTEEDEMKRSGAYKVLALGEVYSRDDKHEAIRFARSIVRDTRARTSGDSVSVHDDSGQVPRLIYRCHWDARKGRIVVDGELIQRPFIGSVRRVLLLPGSWKWNGWVRDVTAKLEQHGWLRSDQ